MFPYDPDEVANTHGYHPLPGDVTEVLSRGSFSEVLVLGRDVPDLTGLVRESRVHPGSDIELARGLYWFSDPGYGRLMLVGGSGPPSPPATVPHGERDDEHPLVNALGWFEALWPDSTVVPTPRFAPGQEVITLPGGQDAVVRRRSYQLSQWVYDVRVDGRLQQIAERNLDAQPEDDDPARWVGQAPAPSERFAATLTRAKLGGSFTDTVFSFRATRTLFRPYQFKPVMKLLETGKLRLLIADEVGLGKTIEAGLVWTEMEARRLANRVLVLCPSSLVAKWKHEMEDRFSFTLQELDIPGLAEFAERLATDRLPARAAYICSIERLRRWEGLEAAAELRPQFDLVIVDEAHAFRNLGTRSNALGALVSEWADALLFLSATPLNLRNEDLHNLMGLLVPGEFEDLAILEQRLAPNAVLNKVSVSLLDTAVDNQQRRAWLQGLRRLTFGEPLMARPELDLLGELLSRPRLSSADIVQAKRLINELHALSAVVTRTRKVEVQEDKAMREPRPVHVEWTPTEWEFHAEFYRWCVLRAAHVGMPVGFAMQMPLRIASTCLPVAKEQVLEWHATESLPVDEDSESPTAAPAVPQVPPPPELVALAHSLGDVDTKFDAFAPVVKELIGQGKQILVFTFSRQTLAYLKRRLQLFARVAVLHGGVPKDARQTIMADFRQGEYDLVLANRVASEGLDFEFCSAVVNYDLPWNPMEVEQRIGRIDRIGQREAKIHIVNFHTPGTIETDIIGRVMKRIGVFERSIGELEPILQSRVSDLQQAIFDFSLTPQQRERRTAEILAAIEEKNLARADVESASSYLISTDGVDIDGLETDLVSRGRYVGQPELALLIADWAQTVGGGPVTVSVDGRALSVRGNQAMAEQLMSLATAGERSRREVEQLASQLVQETVIHLSLDQEWSRTGGPELLTANHPLVRTALRVPGHRQARYTRLLLDRPGAAVPPGRYVVELAVARWEGLRPSSEIWSAVVDLDSLADGPPEVGDAVLAQLANARLTDHLGCLSGIDMVAAVEHAQRQLMRQLNLEEERRRKENTALLETRRISVREVHLRKTKQIETRIETLRRNAKDKVIRLFEAQLLREQERLARVVAQIDRAAACGMSLEPLAVCAVEVPDDGR